MPACEACNTEKSALETYALAVRPFGSVLPHSEEYLRKNMERRLTGTQSWLRESEQSVEWIFCLTAARVLVANQEQR